MMIASVEPECIVLSFPPQALYPPFLQQVIGLGEELLLQPAMLLFQFFQILIPLYLFSVYSQHNLFHHGIHQHIPFNS